MAKLKCLVIEADQVWAGILRRALAAVDIEAICIGDPDAALAQLSTQSRFDLITLDLSLDPEKRFSWGRNLLAVLKTRSLSTAPIIVVSATRERDDAVVCINEYRDRVQYFATKDQWNEIKFLTVAKELAATGGGVGTRAPRGRDELADAVAKVRNIADRFHLVVQQLRSRGGPGHVISNELDVQRLFGALLALHFDDVRPEDPLPTMAGASSRVDFLLAASGIVVETKIARESLKSKGLGEELLVDIARYGGHPACKFIFFFVYDPTGMVPNPRGLENDVISSAETGVDVAVRPLAG